MLDKVKIEPL